MVAGVDTKQTGKHDIVCDSSSIITLSSHGLLHLFHDFSKNGTVRFFIPESVKKEIVDAPLSTRRFKFAAIRVMEALDSGWIKTVEDGELSKITHAAATRIMNQANLIFTINNRPIKIIQFGEAEALAMARAIGARTILVDERATRLIIEDPAALRETIQKRTGKDVQMNLGPVKDLRNELDGLRVIRSAEMAIIGLERGFLDFHLGTKHRTDLNAKNELLLAILYALKDAGCALKENEINEYFKMEHPKI